MSNLINELKRNIGRVNWSRGEEYHLDSRVLECTIADGGGGAALVSGSVAGTASAPYALKVRIAPSRRGLVVDGQCNCPILHNCKHVAALLIEAIPKLDGRWGMKAGTPRRPPPAAGPLLAQRPAAQGALPPAKLPSDLRAWFDQLAEVAARRRQRGQGRPGPDTLLYTIEQRRAQNGTLQMSFGAQVARRRRDGSLLKPRTVALAQLVASQASYVQAIDREIGRWSIGLPHVGAGSSLDGADAARIIERLIESGRCHVGAPGSGPALRSGGPRPGRVVWTSDARGRQSCTVETDPPSDTILPVMPPHYLDSGSGACGPIETGVDPGIAAMVLRAPPVAPEAVNAVRNALDRLLPDAPVPRPAPVPIVQLSDVVPVPVLTLATQDARQQAPGSGVTEWHYARLSFSYNGAAVPAHEAGPARAFVNGEVQIIARDAKSEARGNATLRAAGFVEFERIYGWHAAQRVPHALALKSDEAWIELVRHRLPQWHDEGWRIVYEPGFAFDLAEVDTWYGRIDDDRPGNDWFGLDVGIEIGGQRHSLIAILLDMIQKRGPTFFHLPPGAADTGVLVTLPDKRRVVLPRERVMPIITLLFEMFDTSTGKPHPRRLSRYDIGRLAALDATLRLRWQGGERIRETMQRLSGYSGQKQTAAPAGLAAELRPYQLDGLAWMQTLREYGLSGVLADDMGLGKTLQALAHILSEKEAGRLAEPALVVAPTSVVGNWAAEAERFAPKLRVLVLHGKDRASRYDEIPGADLVITSYALLPRDADVLRKQRWHLAILDEAQYIKNPKTRAAEAACLLDARHRLCLSGTPMENHLGELWSLFRFLMPGFLGDEQQFRMRFRTPIENQNNSERAALLSARMRPFLLRRTKDQVASELPPKTEVLQTIEFAPAQRDLYETVRAAMDKRVRDELAKRGLARSQIIVLDALLKLRQVCCDPRLLPGDMIPGKRPEAASAKLAHLMEMLEELVEEGRRVLVFSQFTSMLELIEEELAERGIAWVKLTGDTTDRRAPVRRFQDGEVPVFLLSLKAGGVGLNLTAADCVIHYDPWWNPAAENQATDRAHRIGQDKPVFVYKLIAADTIEERIVALQQRKGELASALLEGSDAGWKSLTSDDLLGLFAPPALPAAA
jgi:superfamily II DNA or RNA helicase